MEGPSLELPQPVAAVLDRVVRAFEDLAQLRGIALGGSWARGAAREDSDLDVGLYYRDAKPFDVGEVRARAARLDPRPERSVTDFGEWGPWVDGGAWLVVDGRRVDLLYRSLDRLEETLAAARRGEHAWHFGQQPPFGFHGPTLLAELSIAVPLRDPEGELARLRAEVADYPPALRDALVQDFLWSTRFTLLHARRFARRGDVVNCAGCLTRAAATLVQVVYARNQRWFVTDKGALEAVGPDWIAPPGLAGELAAVLAAPGASASALGASVARVEALLDAAEEACRDLYAPPFRLPR